MDIFYEFIDHIGQAEIARRLGVSRSAVHNWRHGKSEPSWESARELARISDGYLTAHDIRPDIFNPGDI